MYGKINRSVPSNRRLIDRLKKEGKPYISELEDSLIFKNDSQNFGRKKIYKNNNNNNEGHNRISFTEALKFVYNFNQKMTKSIRSYNAKRTENNNFKNTFKKVKKFKKYLPPTEADDKNYIFGDLIKQYDKKGMIITKDFFDKDIYKGCGLLMINNNIDKFYKYDFISDKGEKEKRAKKNIDFLVKIRKQAQKLYNKKIIESKMLEEEEKIMYYNSFNKEENGNQTQPPEKKPEIKRQNLNTFINRVNIVIKEIKEEKDEIKKLKKLIYEEEKRLKLQKKKYSKYQRHNFESTKKEENTEPSNQRKEKKTKTINPIMSLQFGKKKKKEINKAITEESNAFIVTENINNINKENTSQSNIINNQNQNNIHSESTNITHMEEKHNNYINNLYSHLSLSNIMRKRLSSINILNRLNDLNKSNSLNSLNTILLNLKKKRRSSFEVPNLKKYLTVSDTYEKIADLDFISYKKNKDKKREKVSTLLKKYYGKKYQEFNKKNNHIKLLNNYIKIKEEIIKSEKKNTATKYKDELPAIMKNKIETCLEQNEKLKNYGNIYIQSFYDKKLND